METSSREMFSQAIEDMPDEALLEQAIPDFLAEQKLMGEFLVWIEKWKALHHSSMEQR